MKGLWGGLLVLALVVVIAPAAFSGEVEDLQQAVQELKEEVAALKAERSLGSDTVQEAIDQYLSNQAAESGETAGYMGGKFGLRSTEGDFKLNVSGGVCFDAMFYEPHATGNNTFDLSLVRLNVNGQVGDGWHWKLQTEFTTSGSKGVRDAYIRTETRAVFGETGSEYFDGISWTFGQFKQPFSLSELTSSYAIDTIMRPTIVRALAPGRDIGVQLSNSIMDDMLYWAFAISNGTNSTNDSNEFTYCARVVVAPWVNRDGNPVENLHFGLSFCTSHTGDGETPAFSTAGGGPYGQPWSTSANYDNFYPLYTVRGRQMMWGFDASWWHGPFAVKYEAIYAIQDLADYGYITESNVDWTRSNAGAGSECETLGGYLAFCYMVTGEDWSEKPSAGLELVVQGEWGQIDPGGSIDEGDFFAWTLGANWYFSKHARVMLNWVATDLGDDTARSSMEDGYVRGGGLEHNLLLRLQLTF